MYIRDVLIINYSLIQTNRYLPEQSCDCTIKGCIVPSVFYLDLVPERGPSPFQPKKKNNPGKNEGL
jgi:hypothetical protein